MKIRAKDGLSDSEKLVEEFELVEIQEEENGLPFGYKLADENEAKEEIQEARIEAAEVAKEVVNEAQPVSYFEKFKNAIGFGSVERKFVEIKDDKKILGELPDVTVTSESNNINLLVKENYIAKVDKNDLFESSSSLLKVNALNKDSMVLITFNNAWYYATHPVTNIVLGGAFAFNGGLPFLAHAVELPLSLKNAPALAWLAKMGALKLELVVESTGIFSTKTRLVAAVLAETAAGRAFITAVGASAGLITSAVTAVTSRVGRVLKYVGINFDLSEVKQLFENHVFFKVKDKQGKMVYLFLKKEVVESLNQDNKVSTLDVDENTVTINGTKLHNLKTHDIKDEKGIVSSIIMPQTTSKEFEAYFKKEVQVRTDSFLKFAAKKLTGKKVSYETKEEINELFLQDVLKQIVEGSKNIRTFVIKSSKESEVKAEEPAPVSHRTMYNNNKIRSGESVKL